MGTPVLHLRAVDNLRERGCYYRTWDVQQKEVDMQVRTLDTDGYVTVPYPAPLKAKVHEAMSAWKQFCALPPSEKQKISGGTRIDDFGYMFRNDSGPRADNKELFHLLKRREPELLAKAKAVEDTRAVAFIRAADALIDACSPTILRFAANVEKEYGVHGFLRDVYRGKKNWTFRFLHYFGGDMLANAHADRLGFTLHLDESQGGGEYLDFNRQWKPWPVTEDQTIIFPSLGLQHRAECKVKALWHRVVPNEVTRDGGRYAMVAFIDFPQTREWDTYRYRVQDFAEGFNYDMSYDELDRLFMQAAA